MDKFSKYAAIELTHFFVDPLVILDGQPHDDEHLLDSHNQLTLTLDRINEPNCINNEEWPVAVQQQGASTCPPSVHSRLTSTKSHMTLSTTNSVPMCTIVPDPPTPSILPRLKFSQSYTIHTHSPSSTSTTANTIKVCESGMLSLQAKLACPKLPSQHIVVKFGIGRSTLHIFVGNSAGSKSLIARGWIKPDGQQAHMQVAAGVDVVGVIALVAVVVRARRDAAKFWRLEVGV